MCAANGVALLYKLVVCNTDNVYLTAICADSLFTGINPFSVATYAAATGMFACAHRGRVHRVEGRPLFAAWVRPLRLPWQHPVLPSGTDSQPSVILPTEVHPDSMVPCHTRTESCLITQKRACQPLTQECGLCADARRPHRRRRHVRPSVCPRFPQKTWPVAAANKVASQLAARGASLRCMVLYNAQMIS